MFYLRRYTYAHAQTHAHIYAHVHKPCSLLLTVPGYTPHLKLDVTSLEYTCFIYNRPLGYVKEANISLHKLLKKLLFIWLIYFTSHQRSPPSFPPSSPQSPPLFHSSFILVQKEVGLPWISINHGISNWDKVKHLPSHLGWAKQSSTGIGFLESASKLLKTTMAYSNGAVPTQISAQLGKVLLHVLTSICTFSRNFRLS